ncbi:MAG: hypothetical protein QG629_755 [Patescibacteria group bacterium]|nr:hypothetical protein [Candidatus Saccharibacteria bacterium]MDQ5963672.1 hypothetical protein [Patescibacteria group bacterium]
MVSSKRHFGGRLALLVAVVAFGMGIAGWLYVTRQSGSAPAPAQRSSSVTTKSDVTRGTPSPQKVEAQPQVTEKNATTSIDTSRLEKEIEGITIE